MEETDSLCIAAAAGWYPYLIPLTCGVDPYDLGLAAERGGKGYIACLAPDFAEAPKAHGTVIFRIYQIPIKRSSNDLWRAHQRREGLITDDFVPTEKLKKKLTKISGDWTRASKRYGYTAPDQ